MDILNGLLEGNDKNSKDIVAVILILVFILGFGKDSGFNLFSNNDEGKRKHHHKHKRTSCSSSGG
jgi:hypothetical protein